MPLDKTTVRRRLSEFDFPALFTQDLGWDKHSAAFEVTFSGQNFVLSAIAEKRGMVALHCPCPPGTRLPDYPTRCKIEQQITRSAHEHLLIFTEPSRSLQIWQWVKREAGKPLARREHHYHTSQSGDSLIQKLQNIAFSLDEEEGLTLVDVTTRADAGFDIERVTKRFYERFKKEHAVFLEFIEGIGQMADRQWYASLMLNRLMFVYFVQRKGFLDGDLDYLRNRLARTREEHGKDKFYSFYRYFLIRLFHEGLGRKARTPELEKLLGKIPYFNGGMFEPHEIERRYPEIQIPDNAFKRIFDYFDEYHWHLDERPLRDDREINPDVLGYIFEKYINQKEMGAYYTKEDITEYISKNTVLPFLFDAARARCKVAFENPGGPTVWDLLKANPDRYIYPAVRHGLTWNYVPDHPAKGEPLAKPLELPAEIAAGLAAEKPGLIERRHAWNQQAPSKYALATEIWREVVGRRQRYAEIRQKLAAGGVGDVNSLVTLNLDIRQFAQDAIQNCEGPDLLRALWHAIEKVSILDPTCGSGAFLFAALNILEPLYEACLERMECFLEDESRKLRPAELRQTPHGYSLLPNGKFEDFSRLLDRVADHPTRYNRWATQVRSSLFANLRFSTIADPILFQGQFPKLEDPFHVSVFTKILAHRKSPVRLLLSTTATRNFIFYQEATQYWVKATIGLPFYAKNGTTGAPAHGRYLYFSRDEALRTVAAVLNSSLFYSYFIGYGDCFHLSDTLATSFPLARSVPEDKSLANLSLKLMQDLDKHAERKTITTKDGDTISYAEFNVSESKAILDEADALLARHYGLTPEELDFVLNYDIKYRLGREGESEGE